MDDSESEKNAPASADEISGWIHKASDGCPAALEQLIDWLSPMLLSWARLQAGSGAPWPLAPEDVVQDVWIQVLRKLGSLAPHGDTGRMTPALLGIARRILRDRVIDIRRSATRHRLVLTLHPTGESEAALAAAGSGPITRATRSERRQLVEAALDRLTQKERALYVRRLIEGLSIDELGAEYGMSADAVIKARQRVRQKLAVFLAPQVLEDLEATPDDDDDDE
ncbi:MAG: sigma-70 family RNA polymerase sigma factor [Planctomycetes bacterium]|nr:sigma-70 family RNA polymerase sigma factor [Planctomycetota bacterium]